MDESRIDIGGSRDEITEPLGFDEPRLIHVRDHPDLTRLRRIAAHIEGGEIHRNIGGHR
ncbi:hypothetical protein GCM10011610_41210 [Nocardia rhizosphaerihabitans]|uniref:Uncharacterized protein n=1 Tax=Nocardia rhizosphaerihabitans TaxID=1691570 RepID=A0ABQ2KKF5_9NOCA|nr:hypothetical protein GCM10011610_41210 [Nocardia rhizosphaerihabitans]